MCELHVGHKQLFTTKADHVLTAHACDDFEGLSPCSHEEADTRMLLHAAHAAKCGHTKILIRTVDTDVVVLAVSQAQHLNCSEIWVAFGTGKSYHYIPAHLIAEKIGPEKALALQFFHAFTGCDTTSAFAGKGKKTAWDVWTVCPNITPVFACLSRWPTEVTDDMLQDIERYVVLLYCRTSVSTEVNDARKELFSKGNRTLENIPPTKGALIQHIRRATFQAACIWGQTLISQPEIGSPSDWGWFYQQSSWKPKWTLLSEAYKACSELVHCGCKKSCRGNCKCFKMNLTCTTLCACAGQCSRQDS